MIPSELKTTSKGDTCIARVTVPAELEGTPLDVAIRALVPSLSGSQVQTILDHGGVWLGPKRYPDPALPVAEGMPLIVLHPLGFRYPSLQLTDDDVLWEDPWLLALRKQAGWFVQPTAWDRFGNVEHAVAVFLAQRDGLARRLHLMHRLDRETSGILLLTKQPEVNGTLQRAWSTGKVDKVYTALVAGSPPDHWSCDEPLGPGPNARYRVAPATGGRDALTDFETVARADGVSEIRAWPRTGRTHQIRLHSVHTGFPLLGDERYAGPTHVGKIPIPRTMLHAGGLAFPHPQTGEPVELVAEPPADYLDAAAALGLRPR